MHLEVAPQLIYLLVLISILIFGLRLPKHKNNNSSVNVVSDVTSNTQITIGLPGVKREEAYAFPPTEEIPFFCIFAVAKLSAPGEAMFASSPDS